MAKMQSIYFLQGLTDASHIGKEKKEKIRDRIPQYGGEWQNKEGSYRERRKWIIKREKGKIRQIQHPGEKEFNYASPDKISLILRCDVDSQSFQLVYYNNDIEKQQIKIRSVLCTGTRSRGIAHRQSL